jgi:hypothetical protein
MIVAKQSHEKKRYQTNIANEVKLYLISLCFFANNTMPSLSCNGGYYTENQLYKANAYDENTTATLAVSGIQNGMMVQRTYDAAAKTIHITFFMTSVIITKKFHHWSFDATNQINDLCYQYK